MLTKADDRESKKPPILADVICCTLQEKKGREGSSSLGLLVAMESALFATVMKFQSTGGDSTVANITGVGSTGAYCSGTDISDADSTGADITGADITGALLHWC